MTWFWLTILYLLFLVTAEIINKKSLNNLAVDEVVFGACIQLSTALVGFLLAVSTRGWHFAFTSESLPLFICVGITYFIAVTLYFTGLKKVDLSLVSILGSSGAIFSLLLGVFILHESLVANKILGVMLIICAGFVLFFKNKVMKFNRFSFIIIIATFFYALGAIFDKRLNTFGNPLSYLTLSFTLAGIVMLVVHYKRTLRAFKGTFRNKTFWLGVGINGLLYAFGFWSLFEAYNRGGEVSRMFPMTLSATVLVPVAGIVLLGERKDIGRKLVAMAIMIVGLWSLGK